MLTVFFVDFDFPSSDILTMGYANSARFAAAAAQADADRHA